VVTLEYDLLMGFGRWGSEGSLIGFQDLSQCLNVSREQYVGKVILREMQQRFSSLFGYQMSFYMAAGRRARCDIVSGSRVRTTYTVMLILRH
jgi:hypothetical protein